MSSLERSQLWQDLEKQIESTIGIVEKKSNSETEAFVRREMIAFLSSYQLARMRRDPVHVALSFFASLNFFSHTLASDLDWEVHLHCLKHISQVIRMVTSDLDKYSRSADSQIDSTAFANSLDECANVSSKFSRQLETANPIEVVFVYSDCLPTLLDVVSVNSCYDRVVIAEAAELIIGLKQNELLEPVLNQRSDSSTSSSSLLNSVSIETLEEILAENRLSSDLYSRHPVSILDDIMSSYQFDLDEDKAADCY